MKRVGRWFVAAGLGAMLAGTATAAEGAASSTQEVGRLQGLLAPVRKMAAEVEAAQELSLTALENAMAAQDEAERAVMGALRSGSRDRINAADRRLVSARRETMAVRDLVGEIMELSAESRAAATAAEEAVASSDRDGTGDAAIRRVEKIRRVMNKAAKRALEVADVLRDRWLVPAMVPSPTTTTTTTTTQPPSPTPVGRR